MTKRCRNCCKEKPLVSFLTKRNTYGIYCEPCAVKNVARSLKWTRKNPERNIVRASEWGKKNPIKIRMRSARYRSSRREAIRSYHAKWRESHRDELRERSAIWRKENAQKMQKCRDLWTAKNPEYVTVSNHRRIARLKKAPGSHTRSQLRQLLSDQNNKCANKFCFADLTKERRSLDHKHPLSRGGWKQHRKPSMALRAMQCTKIGIVAG